MTRFVDANLLERLLAGALLLVLALCSGGAWADSGAEEQLSYRPGSIAWAPCPEFSSLECGVLQLPMDYRQPSGQTFGMAVIRARATQPQRRIGVLLTNPGGPGVSGVDFLIGGTAVKAPILSRLRERFDIISFDPRGVERSHAVRCPVPDGDLPAGANGAAVAAYFDDLGRRYAAGCAQQSGPFVFTLSMNNIARDMEMLRRSLSEPQIGYVGLSFGTHLGAVYASMFPQRLRALVLDAGVSPETGGDALQDFWMDHSAAFEAGFRRLDLLCRQDQACPLQGVGVVRAFDSLYARLKDAPARVGDLTLSHLQLSQAVGWGLYNEARWPAIAAALHAALGHDYAPLAQLLAAVIAGVSQADGTQAQGPILCGTYAMRRPAAQVLPIDAVSSAIYPRYFDRNPAQVRSDRFDLARELALCSAWPQAEPTLIRNLQGRLAHPPLVIGNDFDNATPAALSRRLAAALGFERSVVRYRGGGHGVATSGNPCIDEWVVSYLVDLKLPREGATCPARPVTFAAPEANASARAVGKGGWVAPR